MLNTWIAFTAAFVIVSGVVMGQEAWRQFKQWRVRKEWREANTKVVDWNEARKRFIRKK